MGHTVDEIRSELYALIRDLGKDGGLVSPSVYDTAQVLRFYPPKEGVDPALDWIISRQRADGGWGDPAVPLTRDVPTLAAVLALHQYRGQERSTQERIEAALTFLEHQQVYWQDPPIDALAVATELVLPRLLDEARHAGLPVSADWYRSLQPLRQMKLQRLQGRRLRAGDAPLYSWEALQTGFSVELLDSTGGVGHSPAATAAWLREATREGISQEICRIAEGYLHQANRATLCDIPGVMPTVWPISTFELSYGLMSLEITGALPHLERFDEVLAQVERLKDGLQARNGVGISPAFVVDVDLTAAGLAAIAHMKGQVSCDALSQFCVDDHYYTFVNELNPSVLSNAHAVYALACSGHSATPTVQFLLKQQQPEGHWLADKWHSSWRYTTLEVAVALIEHGHVAVLDETAHYFALDQHPDGGWGMGEESSTVETVFSTTALYKINRALKKTQTIQMDAMYAGQQWLLKRYRPHTFLEHDYWMGKELYSPYRVDRIYELGAIFAIVMQQEMTLQEKGVQSWT